MTDGTGRAQAAGEGLLRGLIDMHIHTGPDVFPRSVDWIEAARDAARAGMRAIVLKDHDIPTTDRAYLASRLVPEVTTVASITLNASVGGLNPWAVENALRRGAKVVWMPTVDARAFMEAAKRRPQLSWLIVRPHECGIRVVDDRGQLLPELRPILRLIADYDAVLSAGHLAYDEMVRLFEAARAAGVRKLKVPHVQSPIGPTLEQQVELAREGVFLSYSPLNSLGPNPEVPLAAVVDMIRAVGIEQAVLITDAGSASLPRPVELFRRFIEQLLACGLRIEDITRMAAVNPARLLGLDEED